ncbi:MAG TPA: FAD-binding protein, partial [Gemmatimonadaceae bacterium]|nr:FAD-binding protein [Gemmatimonadaceae bacterium]
MSATGSVSPARAGRTVHPAIADIADRVRDAHAARAPRRIAGAGTWLDAGQPVNHAERLDVGAARGITEYVPGDLTLTALAGTTLAELHAATRANGQRLTLDPYGTPGGTLGATIATASAGPAAGAFGTPRDITLGLTMVTGTGDIVSAGGRVVKNVAGFDLVRLATGAWGTVGAIVEASV